MSNTVWIQHLVDKLFNWRNELGVKCKHYVTQTPWAEFFMGRGDELEHAAFFALWLSRHVLMTKSRCLIRTPVFSLAARLCSGIKIALAPAVLAIIYNGLRLLKEKLVNCTDCRFDINRLTLVAPFHLVQLWAWERFPKLAPIPRMVNHGEMILARWKGVTICNNKSMCLGIELDSARETFRWRPYVTFVENLSFPSFYDDVGKWVSIDSDDEAWEMFACCLRVCSIEGLEDVEAYNPHRVARQFGFDQDIPCSNEIIEISGFNRQLKQGTILYVPPRLFQGDVTLRYSTWWKGINSFCGDGPLKVYSRRKLTSSLQPVESNMLEYEHLDKKVMDQEPQEALQLCEHRIDTNCDNFSIVPSLGLIDKIPVGCYMLENGDFDRKSMGERSEEMIQLCGHRIDNNSGDLSTVPSLSLMVQAPVECNMLENGNLDENAMTQKSEQTLQVCGHGNDTDCGDLSSVPSLSLIVNAPVENNMLESGNMDEKVMEQKTEETLQLCGHQKDTHCGDLSTVPSPGLTVKAPNKLKSSMGIVGQSIKKISPEMAHDLVSISDDECEDINFALLEALVLNIEERISKLEREVVTAMKSRQHQMQNDTEICSF